MNQEAIKNEIHLADDECCIIFDFGCYFPYSNPDVLTFNFSIGMENFNDYKLNHRYFNKLYQTITRKYGRKLSRLGYPYVMKLNEQSLMLLRVNVGIKERYMSLIFPLQTHMTKDKPICKLSLNYIFDESRFYFRSHGESETKCWNNDSSNDNYDYALLNAPERADDDSNVLIFNDVIEPYPFSLSSPSGENGMKYKRWEVK